MRQSARKNLFYTILFVLTFIVAVFAHKAVMTWQLHESTLGAKKAITTYYTALKHRDIKKAQQIAVFPRMTPKMQYQFLLDDSKHHRLTWYKIDQVRAYSTTQVSATVLAIQQGANNNRPLVAHINVIKTNGAWILHFIF